MSTDEFMRLRGQFTPDPKYKIKRILGISFFCAIMPAFAVSCIIYELAFTAKPLFTSSMLFGIATCFAAPFILGKSIIDNRPVIYDFSDHGISSNAHPPIEWSEIKEIKEAKLGYLHKLRFITESRDFTMPVYSSLATSMNAMD